MRMLPPLSAIRVFEAAGRTENFTAAAVELGMTQAAVSYQVKSLEERLGAALFKRERGRARLTPLGARLLPPLTQAFDKIESAFASHKAEDESLLTISTTQTFANTWLAWKLGGFQMQHPDLAVRMTTSNAIVDLHSGEADIAIRSGLGNWPGLEVHKLIDSNFTPMASPDCVEKYQDEVGRKLVPADLLNLPLIGRHDEWWTLWFRAAGVSLDRPLPRGGIRLDSQANEGHAAMAGQGFALLTPFLWRGDVAAGRLCQLFDVSTTAGYAYWLAFPPERRMLPKIKRFREWLIDEVVA
jgi:LysR family transcriptional regulator, glycine cleavage system transcriptional activator